MEATLQPVNAAYQALLDDVRALAQKHLLIVRVELGHAIAHRLYGGDPAVLQDRLAHRDSGLRDFVVACADELEDLGVSEHLLRQSLAVWAVVVRLPTRVVDDLLLSHLVALTRVKDTQTREHLAVAAVENEWSSRTLTRAIEAVARGEWIDGAPELPGLQPPVPPPEPPAAPEPAIAVVDGKAPTPGRLVQRFEKTARDVADVVGDFERLRVEEMSAVQRERAREALGLVMERAASLMARLR